MNAADLPENELLRVDANGTNVLLVKQDNQIYAVNETCSHAGGPLAEGKLEGDTVVCPWHGSRFCLKDGRVIDGPSTYKVPSYEVRQNAGKIEVRVVSEH
jgi:nitrite reductase/ring-hydroxylating ferredoxin subunit